MTPEEVLMRLYAIRKELEAKAIEEFELDIGEPYTPEMERIDKQIRYYESITPKVPTVSYLSRWEEIEKRRNELDLTPFKNIEQKTRIKELKKEIYKLESDLKTLDYEEKQALLYYNESIKGRGVTVGGAQPHINGIRREYDFKKKEVAQKLNKINLEYNLFNLEIDSTKNEKGEEIYPPLLADDFFLTRKAQEKFAKDTIKKMEEKEIIKKEIIEELKSEKKENNFKDNKQKIKKIIIIKPKLNDGKYKFAINSDYKNTKTTTTGTRIKALIEVIEDKKETPFNKDVFDYFNFNYKCPIYFKGKYQLTKILENRNNYLKINPIIKTEIIAEKTYIQRLNKQNLT